MQQKTSNIAIERIVSLHKEGHAIKEIVRLLNKEGIKPALAKRWNKNMVRTTLARVGIRPPMHTAHKRAATGQDVPCPEIEKLRGAAKTLLDLPFPAEKRIELMRSLFGA